MSSVILFIVSLILLIVGLVLTITLVFAIIGIPLVLIGILLLILSITSFFKGAIVSFSSLFKRKKVIEMKKKKGVYFAR